MASLRSVLALLAVAFVAPAQAAALPGDAPFAPVEPADGAALTVSEAGIQASYACPVYRVSTAGEFFTVFGGPKDYAVGVATAPATDPDGRLAAATRVAINGGTDIGWTSSGDVCSGRLSAPGGPEQRFQEIPGTYYWQVWRLCTGCEGSSYEVGPIRRFELKTAAKPEVGAVKTAYAGYPVLVPLVLPGVPTGTAVVVERKSRGSWKTAGTARAVGGAASAVATLASPGRQTLRARVSVGTDTVTSPEKTVVVRKASSPRVTGKRDDGRYVDTGQGIESLGLEVAVKRGGKELGGFKALVPALCPGLDPGSFTTQIVTATFPRIKIAPDGRFVAARSPDPSQAFAVSGRIKGRKLTEGVITVSAGACSATRTFAGRRK